MHYSRGYISCSRAQQLTCLLYSIHIVFMQQNVTEPEDIQVEWSLEIYVGIVQCIYVRVQCICIIYLYLKFEQSKRKFKNFSKAEQMYFNQYMHHYNRKQKNLPQTLCIFLGYSGNFLCTLIKQQHIPTHVVFVIIVVFDMTACQKQLFQTIQDSGYPLPIFI